MEQRGATDRHVRTGRHSQRKSQVRWQPHRLAFKGWDWILKAIIDLLLVDNLTAATRMVS